MRRSPSTPWCLQQSTQPFITKRGVSVDVGMCLHAPCSLPLVLVSEVDQYLPGLKGPGLTGSGRRRGGASLPAKERGRGCLAHSQGGEAWHWSRAGLGSWPTGGRRAAKSVGQSLPTRLWPATPMKPPPILPFREFECDATCTRGKVERRGCASNRALATPA